MSNKTIPRTITKQFGDVECIYTLTQVIPSKQTITAIESFDNNILFENIINKYFVLGRNEKCSKAEIQTMIQENASHEDIRLTGFDFTLSNLSYCSQYRAFLKYITSLNGVSEVRFNEHGVRNRGFKGIGINHI